MAAWVVDTWLVIDERKILYFTLRRKSDREIGRRLHLSRYLVKTKRLEALRGIALRLTLEDAQR
jgi:hypothetical protein